MKTRLPLLALFLACCSLLPLTGCASYVTPGGKADLNRIAPASIQSGFETKPTHPYPAAIAFVRLQESRYSNYYLDRNGRYYGQGNYSVIFAKEVEEARHLQRIAELPSMSGIVSLNRMLLPEQLLSDEELRIAASKLHADMLCIYTFDTKFFDVNHSMPLSVISLGLSPTRKIKATTTATAMLLDTRTGYIYAVMEATEKADTLSTSWGSEANADLIRRKTEEAAFAKLVDEFVATWPKLLARALEDAKPQAITQPVSRN